MLTSLVGQMGCRCVSYLEFYTQLAPSLVALFNKSMDFGKLPLQWKYVNVTPAFKKGGKQLTAKYRLISLLDNGKMPTHTTVA